MLRFVFHPPVLVYTFLCEFMMTESNVLILTTFVCNEKEDTFDRQGVEDRWKGISRPDAEETQQTLSYA